MACASVIGLEVDRFSHLVRRRRQKWLRSFFGFDRNFENPDGLIGGSVLAGWNLGDTLHHVHAFRYATEGGKLAVQRRLRHDADEELAAIAVRPCSGVRTVETTPRSCFRSPLGGIRPAADSDRLCPKGSLAGVFGFLSSGSPPWIMPFATTRWKALPS